VFALFFFCLRALCALRVKNVFRSNRRALILLWQGYGGQGDAPCQGSLFNSIFYKYSAPLELKKNDGPTGRPDFSTVVFALLFF
jgi:hypothetical protein